MTPDDWQTIVDQHIHIRALPNGPHIGQIRVEHDGTVAHGPTLKLALEQLPKTAA